jgi:predicted transcriptional regulator of viral defense system
MPLRASNRADSPSWDTLFEVASEQEGLFTTVQAAEAGYSPQLLQKHLHGGRIRRVRRGVYRLVHFPPGEHEDLAAVWLWSGSAGVFSHETALALHDLSDALPSRVHLTVPSDWTRRRLRVPSGVVLHHADVPKGDRSWVGSLPVTSPLRTLADSASGGVAPDLVHQAMDQAVTRGLVTPAEVAAIAKAARPSSRRGT